MHESKITVTRGMSGYFAVYLQWYNDPEIGGYYDVWGTGIGRYATRQEAINEAIGWAAAEGILLEIWK